MKALRDIPRNTKFRFPGGKRVFTKLGEVRDIPGEIHVKDEDGRVGCEPGASAVEVV